MENEEKQLKKQASIQPKSESLKILIPSLIEFVLSQPQFLRTDIKLHEINDKSRNPIFKDMTRHRDVDFNLR